MEDIRNLLTPAANKALRVCMDEMENNILIKAREFAMSRQIMDEISVHDVLLAKQRILSQEDLLIQKKKKRTRIFFIAGFSGVLYLLAGLFLYTYQHVSFEVQSDFGIIIAFVGIVLIMLTLLMSLYSSANHIMKVDASLYNSSYIIVEKWNEITKLCSADESVTEKKRVLAPSLIVHAIMQQVGESVSIEELKMLLRARNEIVHGEKKYSIDEIEKLVTIADSVIVQLKK